MKGYLASLQILDFFMAVAEELNEYLITDNGDQQQFDRTSADSGSEFNEFVGYFFDSFKD